MWRSWEVTRKSRKIAMWEKPCHVEPQKDSGKYAITWIFLFLSLSSFLIRYGGFFVGYLCVSHAHIPIHLASAFCTHELWVRSGESNQTEKRSEKNVSWQLQSVSNLPRHTKASTIFVALRLFTFLTRFVCFQLVQHIVEYFHKISWNKTAFENTERRENKKVCVCCSYFSIQLLDSVMTRNTNIHGKRNYTKAATPQKHHHCPR